MIQERLKALRAEMEKRGITVYVVRLLIFTNQNM